MKLRYYNPFHALEELDRRFYNANNETNERNNISSFSPMVNTREDESAYYVEVDLPGVDKKSIQIDVDKDQLNILGERKYKEEVREENYYKVESFFGKFQRKFTLPDNVNLDDISAKNENGVLEITIPKATQKEAKKIEIA